MPKYGESLESFRKRSGGKLEKKLALKIAIQCANCLSYMQEQVIILSEGFIIESLNYTQKNSFFYS